MASTRRRSVSSRTMKRRQQNRNNRLLIAVMVLVMALILSIQMLKLKQKDDGYKEQMVQLQKQLADQQIVASQLEKEEEYVNSEQYIEDTAKSKLGMIHSDEIVFKEK